MSRLKLLYFTEVLAGSSRGSYLVCFGWTTLVVTGDVAVVGQVFVASMLTVLLCSHLVGILVDRFNRRRIILSSHAGIAVMMMLVGCFVAGEKGFTTLLFFPAIILVTALRMMHESAYEGVLQACCEKDSIPQTVARAKACHLVSTALATVASGWLIAEYAPETAFYFSAAFSIAISTISFVLPGKPGNPMQGKPRSLATDLYGGFRLLKDVPGLTHLVILAGVALPIGQLSNAVLSSFVHDHLHLGSDAFGIIDGAWPVGGLIASLLLGVAWIQRLISVPICWMASMVALSTILLSMLENVILLSCVHGLMGLFTWLSRIMIDAKILKLVNNTHIGRARAYTTFAFSFMAIIMCLSPSALKLASGNLYFLGWGVFVLLCSLLLCSRTHHPA